MTRLVARAALLLLPGEFRRAYDRELLALVEDQRTEPEYRGWLGAACCAATPSGTWG